MDMTAGEENFTAHDGDSIWIPRGTVHHFKVTSEVCHVLNGYTPAGFEQVLKSLAQPAKPPIAAIGLPKARPGYSQ
jgi:uncharacterized protein YjlB